MSKQPEDVWIDMSGETDIAEYIEHLTLALRAIARMNVNENTDHEQLSALCISIAKATLDE